MSKFLPSTLAALLMSLFVVLPSHAQTIFIGANQYAFQYQPGGTPTSLGLFFSLTNQRYEFRDLTGATEFSVNPISGISLFRGSVGIGTTSPDAALRVEGVSRFGTSTNYAQLGANGNLSFAGNAALSVANDGFAFRSATAPLAGLVFSLTEGRYEFRDVVGTAVYTVGVLGPNAGDATLTGDLTADGVAVFNTPLGKAQLDAEAQTVSLLSAVRGRGFNDLTLGYLGVVGDNNHEGTGLDIGGSEIGVLGISTGSGSGSLDNYGVYGWSDNAGVRGEHSSGNYAELGTADYGLGVSGGAAFSGLVEVSDSLAVSGQLTLPNTTDISPGQDGPLRIGVSTGLYLTASKQAIQAQTPSGPGVIRINPLGGIVNIAEGGGDVVLASGGGDVDLAPGGGDVSLSNLLYTDAVTGRVGIRESVPDYTLHVVHPTGTANNGLALENDLSGSLWQLYTFSSGDLALFYNGTQKGAFDNASGAYTETSDARVKTDVRVLDDALETVMALQPRRYRFVDQEDERMHYGLIAQELAEVLPELVKSHADSDLYTVSYRELLPFMLSAIQEQQEQIVARDAELEGLRLEAESTRADLERLETLLDRMSELEGRMEATELGLSACCGSGERVHDAAPATGSAASLGANQPNPFDGSTWIPYFLPSGTQRAELSISDLSGRERLRLPLEGDGYGSINLSRGELEDGIYLYSLSVDGRRIATRRMALMH